WRLICESRGPGLITAIVVDDRRFRAPKDTGKRDGRIGGERLTHVAGAQYGFRRILFDMDVGIDVLDTSHRRSNAIHDSIAIDVAQSAELVHRTAVCPRGYCAEVVFRFPSLDAASGRGTRFERNRLGKKRYPIGEVGTGNVEHDLDAAAPDQVSLMTRD